MRDFHYNSRRSFSRNDDRRARDENMIVQLSIHYFSISISKAGGVQCKTTDFWSDKSEAPLACTYECFYYRVEKFKWQLIVSCNCLCFASRSVQVRSIYLYTVTAIGNCTLALHKHFVFTHERYYCWRCASSLITCISTVRQNIRIFTAHLVVNKWSGFNYLNGQIITSNSSIWGPSAHHGLWT